LFQTIPNKEHGGRCLPKRILRQVPFRHIFISGSKHTKKKNTEALVFASKETGLEVTAEKTKYMGMSRDQNAGRSHNNE